MTDNSTFNFNAGSHSFYGMMKITVISGTPTVLGAILSPEFSDIFFAPIYTLPIMFECETSFTLRIKPIPNTNITFEEFKYYLPKDTPEGFNKLSTGVFHSPLIKGASTPIPVQKYVDRLASNDQPTSIFICGGKSTGKSTFSRFVSNRIINQQKKVAFLDLDPGQPEFSIPGCISLTILDDFCFKTPEHNTLNHVQKRVFFGCVSPSDNLDYFKACVSYLYSQVPDNMHLVINSFGWVQDLGFSIHKEIYQILKPKQTFVIHKPDETPAQICDRIFRYELQPRGGQYSISSKLHRELRIYTYFRRNQNYLSLQEPIQKPLSSIRIGFLASSVAPSECLTAINGSLVAFLNDERQFPRSRRLVQLIREVPVCECVGFGIVKAIDKENSMLYIATPEKVAEFNTIVMGPIHLPSQIFTDTIRSNASYLGIGLLEKVGASTEPLVLKKSTAFD
ncbi:hypothetical protein TRFO_38717 [Tritrichomonas foetus]|uniref:Uncharacterized protein n=1 Tax=Tritrichomonas foetus TaxID=1144522 RepID=A0A1J4J8S8_9EUKA|nr:hypothetical protein TRFO_38717 [Tritrichomonas foetus]|eukprot:OHS95097.1 hypothetical protein TRFO_38717 [Tritrichomonas foetus]